MRKLVGTLLVVSLCLGLAASGDSQTTSTTMSVSATVASACSVSATALNFGPLSSLIPQGTSTTSTITVTCDNGVPYNIALDAGLALISAQRHIVFGMANVAYSLCKDAPCMLAWGDTGFGNTFTGGSVQAGAGTGAAQPYTVYGIAGIGSSSPLPAGSYTDTVTVTVHF